MQILGEIKINLVVCDNPFSNLMDFNNKYTEFCEANEIPMDPMHSTMQKSVIYRSHLNAQKAEVIAKGSEHIRRILTRGW